MQEKREFVRVEAHLPITYRVIDDGEYESVRRECLVARPEPPQGLDGSPLNGFDLEELTRQDWSVANTDAMDPLMARALNSIDRKLNLLLRLLIETNVAEIGHEPPVGVNLSGGGLRMVIPDQLAAGQKLVVELTLPTMPPVGITSIAEVVRVLSVDTAEGETRYETALKFIDIHEDDREKIIRYVFKRQRHEIRNRTVHDRAV